MRKVMMAYLLVLAMAGSVVASSGVAMTSTLLEYDTFEDCVSYAFNDCKDLSFNLEPWENFDDISPCYGSPGTGVGWAFCHCRPSGIEPAVAPCPVKSSSTSSAMRR